MTSTKYYRDHLLNMDYPHLNDKFPYTYPSRDIMLTRFWPSNLTWYQMTLTSTTNSSDHLLNMKYPHVKYKIPNAYLSWDTVITISFQDFNCLTSVDPKWPLTSKKTNRDHLLNVSYSSATYEIPPSYLSWSTMFTRFRPSDIS